MKSKKPPMLSKSRFLAGLQCHLRLWYQCYDRKLASETTPAQQAIFDAGHEVGQLATERYPEGILIDEPYYEHDKAMRSTEKAMADPAIKAIYEAAFTYDGVRIRVDVLERAGDGTWNLLEVKSSTGVKKVHYPDVAVQNYVLKGCGLKIDRCSLVHVNKHYVYDGKRIDPEAMFAMSDLTDDVIAMQAGIPPQLNDLKTMLAKSKPPAITPSRHCSDPYKCEFWEHCTKDKSDNWVYNLYYSRQKALDEFAVSGIEDICDIPETFPLNEIQKRIRKCIIEDREYISDELKSELNALTYPVHFLDFETIGPIVPLYPETRPYQTLPFQWSDHILYEDGQLEHREYLCNEDMDPREHFTRTLLDALGTTGSIFIYSTYETRIMNSLIDHFPRHADRLQAIADRFVDLKAIIKNHYYNPKFNNSFSIKDVLPALVPEMSYKNLTIQDGSQASYDYLWMIDPGVPDYEKASIREDLLDYCRQDTLAMVEIRKKLLGL